MSRTSAREDAFKILFQMQFVKEDVKTDPQGPPTGNKHVIRAYASPRGKFDRSIKYSTAFRLVVKAKDIIGK